MSRHLYYLKNGFDSCRLLAQTRDVHRNRDVRVYMLPGEFEYVGVHDGVDKWIAPVIANPFSVDVRKLLAAIASGSVATPESLPRQRVKLETPEVPRVRIRT
jgi:hypothetical protein